MDVAPSGLVLIAHADPGLTPWAMILTPLRGYPPLRGVIEMEKRAQNYIAVFFILLIAAPAAMAQLPAAVPASVGMSAAQLAHIDEAVNAEIAKKQLPGAVVLVGRQGKVVWRRAYGNRELEPQPEPMSADRIFDLSSLTTV